MSTPTTQADVVTAAMSIAKDAAEGKLSLTDLEQQTVTELRDLFGTVVGEGDPLWSLHVDIARQAIALGALSADELSEWLAVARSRAGEPLRAPGQGRISRSRRGHFGGHQVPAAGHPL